MNTLELLETYTRSTMFIKKWYLHQMLEQLQDDNLPEGFKDFVKEQGLDNDLLSNMIAASPRSLFDVFDEHKIYIQTNIHQLVKDTVFQSMVNGKVVEPEIGYDTRKESELASIQEAFKILNTLYDK